jgi:hypothetical protein
VKCNLTITTGPPVLDEETFHRLLASAQILRESNDRLGKGPIIGNVGVSERENAKLALAQVAAQSVDVPVPDSPQEQLIPVPQAGIEPFAPQSHWLIPPETAHQFSILASQLKALTKQEVRSDSEWPRSPVSAAKQLSAEEQQCIADQAGGRKEAAFEQSLSGSVQLISLCEVPTGTSNSPHKIVRKRISQGKELFWGTATVFAVAAVLFLLLGTSVHRLAPLPIGITLSSEVAQQQTPFHRTTATESLAPKPVEPPVLSDQPPARVENSGPPEKSVVKSNSLHSTYDSDTHPVVEDNARVASEIENRIRADRRLQMTQVQVRASNGIVTLLGDVGRDAERVAAAQDAARIVGVEALVNNLRVITNIQSATGALQKPSASVAPIVRGPAAESSSPEAISSSSSRGMASSNTHPTDSKVFGVSSSPSPVSTSAMKTPLSEPEQITVPYGTVLALRLTETLSSDLNQPGDTFRASLASPIVIGNRVIIPEGTGVKGNIVDARNARRFGGRSALVIEVTQLAYNGKTYELRSNQYSEQGVSRNAYAAAAITGGTGVGAIIGTIVGRGKGAAIGAVIGAAAGTGVQAVTKRAPAELRAESTLSFRLETPLTVQRAQGVGPNSSQDSSLSDRPVLKRRLDNLPPDTDPAPTPRQPLSN